MTIVRRIKSAYQNGEDFTVMWDDVEELIAMHQENEQLRKALEYYANHRIYDYELNNAPWWTEFKEPEVDNGHIAREALKQSQL